MRYSYRQAIPVTRGEHVPGCLVGGQVPRVPRPGGDRLLQRRASSHRSRAFSARSSSAGRASRSFACSAAASTSLGGAALAVAAGAGPADGLFVSLVFLGVLQQPGGMALRALVGQVHWG